MGRHKGSLPWHLQGLPWSPAQPKPSLLALARGICPPPEPGVDLGFAQRLWHRWELGDNAGTVFYPAWTQLAPVEPGRSFHGGFYWIIPEKTSLPLKLIPWKTHGHALLRHSKLPGHSWCVWSPAFVIWLFCPSGCVPWLCFWWHCGSRCTHTPREGLNNTLLPWPGPKWVF